MLLQSLRALCNAPGGPGSIWKYLEALAMATRVSGRFACGFWTDLHFADVSNVGLHTTRCVEVPPGAGLLRLHVTGVAVGVFIDCHCVADGVEVTR
jgi:hypothetical protein